MIVLFVIICLFVLAGVFVLWASGLPGGLTLDLGNGALYEFEMVYGLLAILLLGGAIALIWSGVSALLKLPGRFSRSRKASRIRAANKALSDGLLAAEAGDAALARKLSKKATQNADDDRLKLLLEARISEVRDDWSGAERAWSQLARLPGGQLAGLRGAALAARARGDTLSAEKRAEEALALKSGADWPFTALFDSQVLAGRWDAALQTLSLGEKRGLIKGDALNRRRAVLCTARAQDFLASDRKESQRLLAEAIRAAPDFPAAIWHGARQLMLDEKWKAARGVLELGWTSRPHPALAQMASRLSQPLASPAQTAQYLETLIASHPDHRESRILKAELAMQRKNWTHAVRDLALLIEEKPTARLCTLLQKALTAYGDAEEAGRWGRMAITAAREPEWSDLDPRGGAFQYSQADWSRLVYTFGDTGALIYPRFEHAMRELEAGKRMALPSPEAALGATELAVRPDAEMKIQPLDHVRLAE